MAKFIFIESPIIRKQNQGNASEYKMAKQCKRLREIIFTYKNSGNFMGRCLRIGVKNKHEDVEDMEYKK